ncbi:Uracil-regulated protein 1 [Allomyces arbusculus]|nr:Uracil-regulated protein 1 [Allomyces arbusculus]
MSTTNEQGAALSQQAMLEAILDTVKGLRLDYDTLNTKMNRLEALTSTPNLAAVESRRERTNTDSPTVSDSGMALHSPDSAVAPASPVRSPTTSMSTRHSLSTGSPYTSRVVLTTYPGQAGIKPTKLDWGNPDPKQRGPVIASRNPTSIGLRNAIGAHGGSYCIYHALSVAIGALPATHRPDLENTEPPVKIGPHPQWADPTKLVSMDPFGHLVQQHFKAQIDAGLDIRPSIAVTKAHMQLPEIAEAVRKGRLPIDGKIVINDQGDIKVTKAAVEPVWYLPGVAARFGIDEAVLRRCIFEDTGGMYPELITRPDLKVFLPPIGGLTVYIFGPVENMSDPIKKLTLRVHDECNGSDVFGSDICTCRPYLMYGIEEAVKTAQQGGSGVIVYFRKEGRALGEITKYLVYNARKRSQDKASEYFQRTENVAGVKDARFQALMPDVLHWLGITKIDRMMSMSNMKYDAIVDAGIAIKERCAIPDELIPPDSRVEIDAKIAAGYFTASGKVPDEKELQAVQGRTWEWDEIQH